MAINDWMQGDGTDALTGTTLASSIDNNVTAYIQDPLDILLSQYQQGCGFRIASVNTVTVDPGEIVASNSAGTARRFRKMTTSVTIDITSGGLDTGSVAPSTVYYVYITAETSDTAYSAKFSTSSSFPSGINYARKIGYVKTNASSQIVTKGTYFTSGAIAQTVMTEVAGPKTYTIVTNVPNDNSIPQSSEGIEMTDFTTAIIPSQSNAVVEIDLQVQMQCSSALGQGRSIWLFKDSDLDSIAGTVWYPGYGYGTSGHTAQDHQMLLRKRVQLTSTNEVTFKFNVGHFNGTAVDINYGAYTYTNGNVIISSVKITEYRG